MWYLIILILFCSKICHMFSCVMEKPAFPNRDAPIDRRNLFLLSGRAVSNFRHKSLKEKQVPTDRKSDLQIQIICENKLSKAELYKSTFVKTIPSHFNFLHIFASTFFKFLFLIIFSFFILNSIFLLQISSSIIFTYVFSVRVKPIQKFYDKKRKKLVARNIAASKKYCF